MRLKQFYTASALILFFILPFCLNSAELSKINDLNILVDKAKAAVKSIRSGLSVANITENELIIYRHDLKSIANDLNSNALYFKNEISKKEIIIEELNKYGLKQIEENNEALADSDFLDSIKKIKIDITDSRILLIKTKLSENTINELISEISDKQIELRNKDLFVYNIPFYHLEAWISGYYDISKLYSSKHQDFKNFIYTFKTAGIRPYFIVSCILILLIIILLKKYSAKLNSILLTEKNSENKITSFRDILHSREFSVMVLFLKNGLLPSFLVLWFETEFVFCFRLSQSNFWIVLINNISTSIIYIFIFRSIVSIFFQKSLKLLPPELITARKFKKRWFMLIYLISFLFIVNNINIVDISSTINPIIYPNGTALINFIIGLAILFNSFMISLMLKQYFKTSNSHLVRVKSALNNLLIAVEVSIPLLIFFGAANFSTGLILNINQCFLIGFIFFVLYSLLKIIHPIVINQVFSYFYRASMESDNDSLKINETVFFSYWLNIIILAVLCTLTIILFLLVWGVPPSSVYDWTETVLFKGIPLGGNSTFSIIILVRAVIIGLVVFYVFKFIKNIFETKVLPFTNIDHGTSHAIITAIGYIGIISSIIIFVYSLGINITTLTFIISGLSIGIGFALQELFKNFFSGFVLLIERPIKVGDYLKINNDIGIVKKIKIRATEVLTLSKDTLIIPNSELINNTVVNETLDPKTRVDIQVGVAYKSDPEKVINILYEIASSAKNVYKNPETIVEFLNFDDSSLIFILKAFTSRANKLKVASELRTEILLRFRKEGIEIPFPQRDVTIRNIKE